MTLVKIKNNDFFNPSQRGMIFNPLFSEMFDSFLNPSSVGSKMVSSDWIPAVNISETSKDFLIEMSVPGMSKNDLKIEIEKGILTVSGERKEEKKEEGAKFTRQEIVFGSFKRSFTLPEHTNAEQVNASMEHGVLKLSIAKKDETLAHPAKEIKIS